MPITLADATGGTLPADAVQVVFMTRADERVRPSHAALHGRVFRLDDPSLPVPPLDYGCFLPGTAVSGVIDGAAVAFYRGQAVEIRTEDGALLRVTPNHPIPTEHGLIPAGQLKPGDKLLRYLGETVSVPGQHVDEQHKPVIAEEAFDLAAERWTVAATGNRGDNFDGDGHFIDGDVYVVGSYAALGRVRNAHVAKHVNNNLLAAIDASGLLPGGGLGLHGVRGRLDTGELDARGGVGRGGLSVAGGGVHAAPLDGLLLALRAELDAMGQKPLCDGCAGNAAPFGYGVDRIPLAVGKDNGGHVEWRQSGCLDFGTAACLDSSLYNPLAHGGGADPEFFGNLLVRHAGQVNADGVRSARVFEYSGHVYDFRSPYGHVTANGIIASNCRCWIEYVRAPEAPAPEPVRESVPESPAAPSTVPEAYADALTKEAPQWRQAVAKAMEAPPERRLSLAFLALRKAMPGKPASDVRDYARMAVEALSRGE